MRKFKLIILALILNTFLISAYFYPRMPEQMASHWNAAGEVDGYMGRFWGLFMMPLITAGLGLLFLVIPKIDPYKKNIEKFRNYYDGFIVVFMLYMLSVHIQIILWNLGVEISPNITMPVGIGLMFYYIGILTKNAKRNWFIGIRTPWTLSSEKVWNKTHRIGGRLFKACGLIAFTGVMFREYAVYLILVPVLLASIYLVIYSYIEYRNEKH